MLKQKYIITPMHVKLVLGVYKVTNTQQLINISNTETIHLT